MDPGDEMIMIQEVVNGRKSRTKEKSPRTGKRKTKEHEPNIKCSHRLANSSSNPKAVMKTEKDYRRMEDILTPNGYHKILENHGTVKNLNKDW
ncbi:hypothetical protein ANN_15603 [Periplaneta americana]|uniref:Uncharacterized protein n=1 Tax=Periplaneta americana TaxID=6978 RepID=A0ABQ8SGT4_PERAM|nr:hypothetical protein ANN_15603 [Periplaneta americana]